MRKRTKKQTEETDEQVLKRLFPKEIVKAVKQPKRTNKGKGK
jgi:hypothetical protein